MFSLYLAAMLCFAVLVVPGTLGLRAIGLPLSWSIICSPLVGLSLLAVVGQALSLIGIASSPLLIFGIEALVIALVFAICRALKAGDIHMPNIPLWMLLPYLLIGAALGYNLFISRLGSADALFQAYDVTQHLNLIQSMSESGRFTSIGVNPYMSAADAAIAPVDYSSFYPAAWHALCALVIMLCGALTTVTINASMFALAGLVFPLAVLALISALFPNSKKAQFAGAVVSLAFVAFPWNLLAFGPVYANVAGFCLMPAAMAIFICLFADGFEASDRARFAITLLLGVIGLALCHPNTIFTCILLLSPYCVHRICDVCNDRGAKLTVKLGVNAGFALLVASFWCVCYKLPFFEGTVSHVWKPYAWAWQEIVNIVTLSYTFGFKYFTEETAQYALAALVLIGFVKCLFSRGKRWMAASYLLICYILLIAVTHRDEYKQLLAGFWYTDPMRLASVCVIAAVPLATMGLQWLHELICRLLDRYNAPLGRATHVRAAGRVLAALFLVVNFMPSFNIAGAHRTYTEAEYREYSDPSDRDSPIKTLSTTFGDYRNYASSVYSNNEPLDSTERVFISKVKEIIGEDDLIINDPMDGSFLTYGMYDMRVYYRNFTAFNTNAETEASQTIRLHLSEYAENEEVQKAVKDIDARYVIVLRGKEVESGFINLRGDYDQSLFTGITSITKDTSGFKLVLQTGPMALYEIER